MSARPHGIDPRPVTHSANGGRAGGRRRKRLVPFQLIMNGHSIIPADLVGTALGLPRTAPLLLLLILSVSACVDPAKMPTIGQPVPEAPEP